MLCDEAGMVVPGRLLPIIDRESRCQSFFNKLCGMLQDRMHPLLVEIVKLLLMQVDPASKLGLLEIG
jgi:hypothetical protein